MPRYKVGDRVRVRNDLCTMGVQYYMDDKSSSDVVTSEMLNFCGQIMTISRLTTTGKYILIGSEYNWTDEMLDNVVNIDISSGALIDFL